MQDEETTPVRVRVTDRLRLEPIGAEHAEDLLHVYQDPAVAEWFGVWTREMAQDEVARMARGWEMDGVHKWMAYDRTIGTLIGRGGLSRVQLEGQERLEIGWVVRGQFWGQGYATEIGRAGLTFAFDELTADEVVSFTEARNARSRAVMERLGFRYHHNLFLEEYSEPFVLYSLNRPS
jgi:RimJ/RimL family protein N-acetyltransferase